MLETIKTALRISTSAFDNEIQTLIDAAILEMAGLGVTAATSTTTIQALPRRFNFFSSSK